MLQRKKLKSRPVFSLKLSRRRTLELDGEFIILQAPTVPD